MARHYTVREFFRQVPDDLLRRYFESRNLFADRKFAAPPQERSEALFEAWVTLPDGVRGPIDAEFREIFDLACEKGFRAIQDEAAWRLAKDPPALLAREGANCGSKLIDWLATRLSAISSSSVS